MLAYLNYDFPFGGHLTGKNNFLKALDIDLHECLAPEKLDSARKVFERQIRYWICRPMAKDTDIIVSPADAKALVGSLCETSHLFIKDKFFSFEELLGTHRREWLRTFAGGEFAIFRLTPEMYHYNHSPVAGTVLDIYTVDGDYHSCNPAAVITIATPYSMNKRVITIIDTDVAGGSQIGRVAMIEIVALMIGDVVQAYSEKEYFDPKPVLPGMFLTRGAPKSLYCPGSSTDVLLFERGRIRFDDDLVRNRCNPAARSRFSLGFGVPLVETLVKVRSSLARRIRQAS